MDLISAREAHYKTALSLYSNLSEKDKNSIDIINRRILEAIAASKNYVELLYSDKELNFGRYPWDNDWKKVLYNLGYKFERIEVLDGDGGRYGDETIEIGMKILW